MTEAEVADLIHTKILELFPEARSFIADDLKDFSYLSMGALADYLETIPDCHRQESVVYRVKEFSEWAQTYPRGQDAGDDILTIYTVGFAEKLFERQPLRGLVPLLFTKADLINNKDYWTNWVGATEYAHALKLCDERINKKKR